jgi:aspartate aminotransferase
MPLSLSRKVSAVERSQTLLLFSRAKKMKSDGVDVVSLTAGEPDFPTPQIIKEAGIRAIQENFTKYTQNQGIAELLKAVAEKFRRDNGIETEPSRVLVSNGAKHSVFNGLQAICNRGDEVIIPAPYWVSYPEMVKLVDAKPVIVQTSFDKQFKITPSQLKRAVSRRTKAIIFCTPSNPTGAVYSELELRALASVVATHSFYVISDEIYEKILYDGATHFSLGSIPEIAGRVITINGASKAYAMTGWRMGFLTATKEIVEAAEKVQGQITSNASSISQKAILAGLTNDLSIEIKQMVGEFDKRRRLLIDAFGKMNIPFVHPRGAFYLFFNAKQFLKKKVGGTILRTTDDLCEHLLMNHLVAMVPGTGFGAPDWVRLSYACSMQELEKAVLRLQKAFGELASR